MCIRDRQTAASLLIPAATRYIPHSRLVSGGLVLAAVGLAALMRVNDIDDLMLLVVGMTIMGMGVMPMMILGTDMVVSAAPATKAGAASATSETATELGMALGIAVIGSVGAAVYRRHMLDAMPAGLNDAQTLAAGDTLGGAIGAAAQLPPALAAQVLEAARAGFSAALHTNSVIGAVIIAGTALMTALLLRGRPAHATPATAVEPIEEQF